MTLPIGLIGCGRAAERYYLPAFARVAEARLVAVADPLAERRDLIASGLAGCMAFPSAEALLEKARVAALIVATPPATHIPLAMRAVRAGIPVLVEKPLAPSMAEVPELEALVASSRGSVMLGFTRRYWTPVRELRRIMGTQTSDDVSAQLVIASNVRAWSAISGLSDPLEDLVPHQLDLLRYVFDREILAVRARWHDPHTISMQVTLVGGIVADCRAAFGTVSLESAIVRGRSRAYAMRAGSERLRPADGAVRSLLDLGDRVRRRLRGRQASMHGSFEQQLASFCRFVRAGAAPEPGLADGIAAVRAVDAARQSADRDGKEVVL